MKCNIIRLVTQTGVEVDSVCHTIWNANDGGVKEINADDIGVHINWNFGSTFVPWSNVRYVKE